MVDGTQLNPEAHAQYLEALKAGKFESDKIYSVPMADIYADAAFNVRGTIQPLTVLELSKEL